MRFIVRSFFNTFRYMDYNFVIETEFYCLQLKLLITMLFAEVQNSLHKDMRVYNKLAGPREIVILVSLFWCS